MPSARRLLTNFSKGELSPLVDGRPDLAAYFEGGLTIENFFLLRQGGLRRRPGTRFVAPTKFPDKDSILIPFEFSVADAFVLEFGDQYIRFYRNGIQVLSGGVPYELASPYLEVDLRFIHFTQSADVIFLFHPNYQQRRLSRIADTNWVLTPITHRPPPSFEADSDVSDGTSSGGGGTVPSVSITSPADGAIILTPPGLVHIVVAATDTDGIARVDITYSFGGAEYPLASLPTFPYIVDWPVSGFPSTGQVVTLRATAINLGGHSTTSAPVSVQIFGDGAPSGGGGPGGGNGGG